MRALLLLLVACGPSGSFRVDDRQYNADKIAASSVDGEGLEGLRVKLTADPIGSAIDDEIAVEISVFWNTDQRPALNQEVSVGKELAVRAVPRVSCFCGAKDAPLVAPDVKGKFKLTHFSDALVSGEFDLTFTGQIPYAGGGVLYDNATLKVNAAGFELKR